MPLSCDRDSARSSPEETTPRSALERDETLAVSRGPDPPQLITTLRLAPPHVPYLVTRSFLLINQRAYREREADTKTRSNALAHVSGSRTSALLMRGPRSGGEIGSRLNY